MASSLIGSLRVSLGLDTAQFESGANKARQKSQQVAHDIESSFKSAKTAVTGLFAAFTVGLLADQIKKSLEYAGSIAEVSRTLGVTTKDLQTFRYAASQTGVAQDQLEVGLRRLTVSMGKAELGSTAQIKAFNALGITVADLKGKTTGDIFRAMSDSLSKVTDRSQRAAIEMTLMGRSGSTLDNLLAPGSRRLNELAESAQRLGIVLSDQQIQGAEETAHKLEAVKEVLSAQIAGVVANNASAILSLSSALATLTGEIVKFLGSNPQLALGIIGALLGGRVGGLPGAVLGGAAGALLGGRVAQSADDANPDLAVRTQRMWAARQAYLSAVNRGASPAISVGGIQSGGGAPDTLGLLKEWQRQIGFLKDATAQSRARATAGPHGVDLPKFLGGGGGRSQGAPKKAPRDRSLDEEYQIAQQERQADADILAAKLALAHHIEDQTTIQLQQIELERQSKDAEADHRAERAKQDLAEGRITQAAYDKIVADAAIIKGKQDEVARLKVKAVLDERDRALIQQQEAIDSHYYDVKQEMLKKQEDLSETQSERRKIELELLDIAYREKKQALERLIETSTDDAAIANARLDLQKLNANYALDRQNAIKQTRGPFEEFAAGLPRTTAQINDAIQGIEVSGLEHVVDLVGDFGKGWKAVRDDAIQALQDIESQLLKLGARELLGKIFKPSKAASDQAGLAAAGTSINVAGASLNTAGANLTTAAGLWQGVAVQIQAAAAQLAAAAGAGGGGGLGGVGGLVGSLFGAGGGLIGGAAPTSLGSLPEFLSTTDVISTLPGLASGGDINIMGKSGIDRNLLSLNGLPVARVSMGERISVSNDNSSVRSSGGGLTIHAPITIQGNATRQTLEQAAGILRRRVGSVSAKGLG